MGPWDLRDAPGARAQIERQADRSHVEKKALSLNQTPPRKKIQRKNASIFFVGIVFKVQFVQLNPAGEARGKCPRRR